MKVTALVFDMDGTIADLYNVPDWLSKLRSENPSPYADASPMWDMETLVEILRDLQSFGIKVIITSWLSKNSSEGYKKEVRKAKREWLSRYDFPFDEIHLVQYGTRKDTCSKKSGGEFQILFDDSEEVRNNWRLGQTINPTEIDRVDWLYNLRDAL